MSTTPSLYKKLINESPKQNKTKQITKNPPNNKFKITLSIQQNNK